MTPDRQFKIAAFYKFVELTDLDNKKSCLLELMEDHNVSGTIIIAEEGLNGTVSAVPQSLDIFLTELTRYLQTPLDFKFSFDSDPGFARRKVKIKKEIVTLKKDVDIKLGAGTHVDAEKWNEIISDPETIVIDARNDYEYKVGTFKRAINPQTDSFSELPEFIESNFDPSSDPKIAMFCTGGIRCEKLAPFLVEKGFRNVIQLKGGILRYLERVDDRQSLWEGECFVFDERVTVDSALERGSATDFSALKSSAKKKDSPGKSFEGSAE